MKKQTTIALVSLLLAITVYTGCVEEKQTNIPSMKLSSPAFKNGENIPIKYTCDGENISPPLNFSNTPEKAKSLVIIMDDPDAPMGTFTHWMMWNIPANTTHLLEGENVYPQGTNDFGVTGYKGPCPPSGTHHYYLKVYALDTLLDLQAGAHRNQLENAMSGHVLAEGQLMGVYSK
ncbi:MAG TPA: YbhB/YbcL family Raf kinase inhibitor-like protein [Thermoplasmatales archaeon]|nr:YbhB/YbcL family Raf kinase inhibitor-like protein [Thermoplasmatales archaeon]